MVSTSKEILEKFIRELYSVTNYMKISKVSYVILHTDEAIKEVHDLLDKRSNYIGPDGKIIYTASNTVIDVVTKTLSWEWRKIRYDTWTII